MPSTVCVIALPPCFDKLLSGTWPESFQVCRGLQGRAWGMKSSIRATPRMASMNFWRTPLNRYAMRTCLRYRCRKMRLRMVVGKITKTCMSLYDSFDQDLVKPSGEENPGRMAGATHRAGSLYPLNYMLQVSAGCMLHLWHARIATFVIADLQHGLT